MENLEDKVGQEKIDLREWIPIYGMTIQTKNMKENKRIFFQNKKGEPKLSRFFVYTTYHLSFGVGLIYTLVTLAEKFSQ